MLHSTASASLHCCKPSALSLRRPSETPRNPSGWNRWGGRPACGGPERTTALEDLECHSRQ
jgi:hypothetical protein